MSYKDPLEEFDLKKFVAWILSRNPTEDPKLPLDDPFDEAEWKRAEMGDKLHDAMREATFGLD